MSYPVLSIVPDLKGKLQSSRVVVVQAPPGAGKSTVLPLELLDEPWLSNQKIILLEPRRLAARAVAMRMAELRKEDVGATIGYRVRFDHRISKQTRLEVVTEGILTRILQQDNTLAGVGLLIFDEFHERSLHADLALALSLQVQDIIREDLRILIMSATLDGEKLSETLGAPLVKSAGRQYPVSIRYSAAPENAPIAQQVARGIKLALKGNDGDVLAFLPGAGEIRRTAELLENEDVPALVYPLFGDLSFRKQQEAILPDPQGRRKIVLATSIAETSLTIEGVNIVVDSGFSRVPRFEPRSGFTRLETVRVTRDAADQRAGRAGRTAPGVCYRLWTQGTHLHLVDHRNPEILDADLAPMVLELAAWNIRDVNELTWITPPPTGAVNQAVTLLEQLGAINNKVVTERGREMLTLPTHPRLAHMLLEARDDAARNSAALGLASDIAALLEERDPLDKSIGADISLRIDALRRWRRGERVPAEKSFLERIERLAAAWRQTFRINVDNEPVVDTQVGKLLMAAYPERIARQTDKHSGRYKMVSGRGARLPDHDPLAREPWLAIAEMDAATGEGKIFLAAPLDVEDLRPLAEEREAVSWDADREMVIATQESRIGNLVLSSRPLAKISEASSTRILCEILREKGLAFLEWDDDQRSWQARVMSLRSWRTDEPWPDVSEASLLETAETWLAPFVSGLYKRSELLKLDLNTILSTLLPWEINARLQQLAPPRLPVPSGSQIKVEYFMDGRPPVMEVRLQEVFGMLETPTVNDGRNKIVMHLLSPGFKPVQVTQDLKSFWANTYAEVRKELRARYPKHSWPEDPWTAEAIRGAKRKR